MTMACGESPTPPAPEPASLAFATQPGDTPLGSVFVPAPKVVVQDASGSTLEVDMPVTLSLAANTDGAGLLGTLSVNAVDGVATFEDVRVDRPGGAYALQATATGLSSATSDLFDVAFRFSTVAAGSGHSCGMTPAGVYCWGVNHSGQLGAPVEFRSLVPVRITQPETPLFASVAVGPYSNCALSAEGAAHCWGSNMYGMLGDGSTTERPEATPVSVPAGVAFRDVAVGTYHTCAVAVGGSAYCWGRNDDGQLGNGTKDEFLTAHPLPEPVAAPDGVSFDSITVGAYHSCALSGAGDVYCWGENIAGQLGNGADLNEGLAPSEPLPVAVAAPSGLSFVAVSAGRHHTCGLSATGEAWCWGDNQVGKLGDGTTDISSTPVAVLAPEGRAFQHVDAGGRSTCGVTTDGAAWCWGDNDVGVLGTDDGSYYQLVPTAVAAPDGVSFSRIQVGDLHACALATDGRAYCWGANNHGRLGDGTIQQSSRPVLVAGQ